MNMRDFHVPQDLFYPVRKFFYLVWTKKTENGGGVGRKAAMSGQEICVDKAFFFDMMRA